MGAEKNKDKVTIIAGHSGIIVEAGQKKRGPVGLRLFSIVVCAVAVVAIVLFLVLYPSHHKKQAAATKQQARLQKSVTDVNAYGNLAKMQTDSSALIDGAQNGTYKPTPAQLAQAYGARGDAEFNSGNETAALTDYKRAVALDASQQDLVGYNEFVARYHQGERKLLIPLLQTLAKPLQNDHEQGAQQLYSQYESYISDLQAGKDLGL